MVDLKNVGFSYAKYQVILEDVTMNFEKGKLYAILGESGCGKTTLLSLIGGLDLPTDGSILFEGRDLKEIGLERHRKENVAFVFQNYNLIDYMTAIENVALTAKSEPGDMLQHVGIEEKEQKRNVLKLSGGQQQRVAIARALASEKPVILADEPTGNLDEKTAAEILELLKKNAHEDRRCVIIVTHSERMAQEADVIYRFKGGEKKTFEEDTSSYHYTSLLGFKGIIESNYRQEFY